MQSQFGQYGEKNEGWSPQDAKGFIKLLSVPLKNYYKTHDKEES
jgi:argininosuccinate synthase